MLRDIFLIAQPPLLGEEGKIRDSSGWATPPVGRGYDLSPLRGSISPRYSFPRSLERHASFQPALTHSSRASRPTNSVAIMLSHGSFGFSSVSKTVCRDIEIVRF